ncbi:MAG TPA: carbohydrate-binding family 9-like protein [Armatimonadota bacterium]|jgi:hypothetical protein
MAIHTVMVLPHVAAPGLDQAFLSHAQWQGIPSCSLVRAEDGGAVTLATSLRVAWSARGVHVCFCCTDPSPLSRDFAVEASSDMEEAVGVFLDPIGDRSQYMAIMATPYGGVADARIENPWHHSLRHETDETWDCPGVRLRSWSQHAEWSLELLIPFNGITPAIDAVRPGDRWTGNFFRIAPQPPSEISAWQPCYTSPPDLHASDHFGILEFGH